MSLLHHLDRTGFICMCTLQTTKTKQKTTIAFCFHLSHFLCILDKKGLKKPRAKAESDIDIARQETRGM